MLEKGWPSAVGQLVPDYELLRRIGAGAYGEVWLARSNATGALRAAKIVWRSRFEDERPYQREFEGIQRFERISREHPSQLALFHIGRNEAEGYFYYVMELADPVENPKSQISNPKEAQSSKSGTPAAAKAIRPLESGVPCPGGTPATDSYTPHTLRADLANGRLPPSRVLEIGLALSEALVHLHENGLVHRDVKPSNVIFVNGRPKLADIGLVTNASDQCSIVGTEGYLPPEGPGTPQADIFALGKVLYEAATGLDRRSFPELPEDLRTWPERRAVVELNEIVLRACAREANRYQSAEAMQADLLLLKAGKSVRHAHHLERRLKLMTRVAIGVTAALVLGVVPYALAIKEARRARLAEADAKDKLWKLYGSQARAARVLRYSHVVGWRFEALDYLKKAAQMGSSLDLRDEAIACLATPDLHLTKQWDGLLIPGSIVDFDFEHQRYVRSDPQGGLSIRSLENDSELFPLPGSGAPASTQLVFSPTGRYLLAGYDAGYDGYSCKVWDLETRKTVLSLTNFLCRGGTFSPDEATIALGEGIEPTVPGRDQTGMIHLYHLATHTESRSNRVTRLPNDVCFDPTGRTLAVSLLHGSNVLLLQALSGQVIRELETPENINHLAWHPDGKRLAAACGDKRVYVWDLETTNQPTAFVGHHGVVMNVQYSSDGNWLASAAWDGSFRLWDSLSGKQILSAPLTITFFRHSRDDRLWGYQLGGKRLGIWEAATARELRQLYNIAAPEAGATWSALNRTGELLAVGYEKDGVRIWNLHSGRAVAWLPIGAIHDLAFAGTDDEQLFTCTDTGLQRRSLAVSGDDKLTIGPARQVCRSGAVLNVSFDQLGRSAYVQNGKVHLLDVDFRESQPPIAAAFPFNQVLTSSDGALIAAWAMPAYEFQIWNRLEHRLVKTFPGKGVGQAAFSHDGRTFAFGDARGYSVVQVGSWATLLTNRQEIDFKVYALVFSPDGNLLAMSCAPETVILLDTHTWREVARLEAPEPRPVVTLDFTPDSSRLVATCDTQTIQIWDLNLIHRDLAELNLDWSAGISRSTSLSLKDRSQIRGLQPSDQSSLVGRGEPPREGRPLVTTSPRLTEEIGASPGIQKARAQTGPGYALSFDGINDTVQIPGFGNVAPTNEITIEFWQKVSEAAQQSTFCTSPLQPNNGINAHIPYVNGNDIYWDFGSNSAGGRMQYTVTNSIIGTWQHFALVASQTGNYMRIYRNGILEASKRGMTPFVRSNYDLAIGGIPGVQYGGLIDEFRIWNVARSPGDILSNMCHSLSLPQSNLVSYWRLDEGRGTNVFDASGNGRTGTLQSASVWELSTVPFLPTVLTLPVGPVSNGVATLNGNVNPNGSSTAAWSLWGTTTNYTHSTTITNLGNGTNDVAVAQGIAELLPDTTYHCQLIASNVAGLVTGKNQSFHTPLPGKP